MAKYLEDQYHILDDEVDKSGVAAFGRMSSFTWNTDPKRLLFVLARYKFAAKMLEGCSSVIEIGCGDGFGSRIVRQHVSELTITDADPIMVEQAAKIQSVTFPVGTKCHNFVEKALPANERFDGAYLLDVLEHISPKDERNFLFNISQCLTRGGKIVIGMPSLESQRFASEGSKAGHVNCKTKEELYLCVSDIFDSVCCFSMNDEVVHTGFSRMANYIFAVATK